MNPLRQQMFPPDEEEFDSGSGDDMGESFCGNNNGISPDAEDDEEADEAASTSGGSFDGETSAAENFFVKENNDVKVLFAMGIGLLHDDGSPFSNWEHKAFDKGKRKRSAVKPGKDHLTAERRRRLIEGGMRNPKFNSQAARHVQLKWLTDNPITTDVDVAFIKATIKSVINKASAVQRKQGKSNAQDLRWHGSDPFVRLLHAITDLPANKAAFSDSFRVLTREELDGRSNPETARPDAWKIIAETFNAAGFDPTSEIYNDTHADLSTHFDISYEAIVLKMGELTAEKAKDKFMEMKSQSSIVVARFEASGGGDGQRADEERDFQRDDGDKPIVTMENDYSKCLKTYGTHVLYFLKHICLHEIVAHSVQQLNKGFCLEGNEIPGARSKKKKRRGGDAGTEEFKRQMTRCNEQMSTMNQTALAKHIAYLQGQATEMRREIRKMRRNNEPAEDIGEEEEALADLQLQLDQQKKKYEEIVSDHERAFRPEDDVVLDPDWDEYERECVRGE